MPLSRKRNNATGFWICLRSYQPINYINKWINTNFVEHKRHFLSTYFLVDPFLWPYWFYSIRRELIDISFIISYFLSTFCPTLGHHQGRIYYKSDTTFVCTLWLCKKKSVWAVAVYITVCKLFVLDRNTWYYITVCKLFVLDRNTWYYITVCKLFVLDRNTWYYITVCKLFVLDRNIWYYITERKLFVLDRNTWYYITVCKLFVLDRTTWYYITVCKLFVLDKNTWYYITVCKLFVLDRNTWYHITVCKLFVLDRNTWYHITVCKQMIKQLQINQMLKFTDKHLNKWTEIKHSTSVLVMIWNCIRWWGWNSGVYGVYLYCWDPVL